MIAWLRSVRLSWPQIAMIAAASALATAVIVDAGTRDQRLPYSALAALHQRVAVHSVPQAAGAPAPAATAAAAPAAATALAAAAAPAAVTAPADAAALPPASSPAIAPTSAPASTSSTPPPAAASTPTAPTPTGTTGTDTVGSTTPASAAPAAGHVFVIALTTSSYRAAFGPGSVAHYLNRRLRRHGVLLSGYRTLGGSELPDYLAMVSGQAPNADTRTDCATYAEFGGSPKPLASGQVPGAGCVYPNTVLTIGDQLTAAGRQWKAYVADMGNSTCPHPNSGAADDTPLPGAGTQYTTRHNPFVYFHSLLDLGGCSSDDVGLQHLGRDLRRATRTPNYAYIAPDACDEPGAAACPAGQTGGLAGEDAFLKRWVPVITASPAYRQNGVLMIMFAKAPMAAGSGPIRTGALILSPKAKAGSTVTAAYTPYSVLRSVEDLLGYTPLVHAKAAKSFAAVALPGR